MAVEVQRPPAQPPRPAARPRPKREREEEVLVWPDLVFIEFVAAVLFTITFLILSVFINAPLLNRANPDVTPNPSKAPWYFLNLQELLLHMDKAWAGVLLPTVALLFFASIPYIDRSRAAQGIWFGTKYSVRITLITLLYAVVVSGVLVAFDAGDRTHAEYLTRWIPSCSENEHVVFCLRDEAGAKHLGIVTTKDFAKRLQFSIRVPKISGAPGDGHLDWPRDFSHMPWPFNRKLKQGESWSITNVQSWGDWKLGSIFHGWGGEHLNMASATAEQVIPLSSIAFFALLIIYALFRLGWVRSRRDIFIVMFTGVMFAYLTLSLVGSFFRGQGQALIWPWHIKVDEG
ncbi:MAG TPA: hypothetical protein VFT91_03160 [Dehalococcoidia bacterium]|nr:hypothetical protein [Dehalococcoidia bacterium]